MTQEQEIQNAKATLEKYGYVLCSLWHIDDCKSKYDADDAMAREIVEGAIENDWITEQINVTIDDFARDRGLRELTDEERDAFY